MIAPDVSALKVLEGVELRGQVNTPDAQLAANITASIRRGHPQIKPQALQMDPVALVCGGPSLASTEGELRDAVFAGAKVVTVNGAYEWCLARNIRPSMQIVMDARAFNARFVEPAIPRCHYVLASQAHPALFDAVKDRPNVWIFHVGVGDDDSSIRQVLDAYYLGRWSAIIGGTTVGTRALALLRGLGYLRFDIFGMDSCWLGDSHHAYAQAENDRDQRVKVQAHPTGHPSLTRTFECAPWHVQQAQDFLQFVRFHGHHLMLRLHGDGLLAHMLTVCADVVDRDKGET